ncbi:MAG: hypothetical protein WC979_05415 [Candidatus Pacearchaeota archaeon]|jgi:predicted transcriptional regulator
MMKNSNPTIKTQEEIIKAVFENENPLSLTAISKKTNKSLSQVKATIIFLENLGIVKTLVSSGNTTLVIKIGETNGTTN